MATLKIHYDARQSSPNNATQFMNNAFNAVMSAVFDGGTAKRMSMMSTSQYIIDDEDQEIDLVRGDIRVSLNDVKKRSPSELDTATLVLTSESLGLKDIMASVKSLIHEQGRRGMQPGDPRYIFDMRSQQQSHQLKVNQYVNSTPDHIARMQRVVSAPKSLSFSKHVFHSTKTFDNLCGEDVRMLKNRVDFFLNNRDWYESKGIPYQLGIILSGPCGTGKSSAIRAIANATDRCILNVNLAGITTSSQLKRLFLSPTVSVFETDDHTEATSMHLPIGDRIYVLDEVDALGAVVASRANALDNAEPLPDELNLGELLNIFDGGVEVPGRIIVMLSNYPERIDSALMRPGRIDVHIEFSLCTRDALAELFRMYHGRDLDPETISMLPHRKLSPAEASDVFIRRMSSSSRDEDKKGLLDELNDAANKNISRTK